MKTEQEFDYDLVIVGGNIVGATLACALKESNLKILLVDAQSKEQAIRNKRCYAFSILSGEIYKQIGIWQDLFPHMGFFKEIRLSDGFYSNVVGFFTEEIEREYLGYVGEHGVILESLYQNLEGHPNINWVNETKVIEVDYQNQYSLTTLDFHGQKKRVKSKLVVGADGAKSLIRQAAQIKTKGWKYWQSCLTFTIKHQAPRNDIAYEKFWQSGPMGILPLPGNQCQIVWTNPHKEAKLLLELDEHEFLEELKKFTGEFLGSVEINSPRILFPVQLMQSNRYILPRLALIGDAAHTCHPVGGQGLNLGIRDAAALAQVIKQAYSQNEDIGSVSVLKRYERWRKFENLVILAMTDLLDRIFSNSWLPLVGMRHIVLQLMRNIKPIKLFSLKLMTGLKGRHPQLN
jgi:2-octaprenyl-6-methoxyphenol hydroxylase